MKINNHLESIKDYALTFMRIWLGGVMMWYSFPVLFQGGMGDFTNWIGTLGIPLPSVLAVVGKCSEFFGGLMILTGFYSRIGAFFVAITMFVATATAGNFEIFTGAGISFNLFIMSTTIFIGGSGKFSLKG
ncbi:MAG: DoxX family protein [Cyclobacteriaceae bacterium]